MAYLINLRTFTDETGSLTVLEKEIPFQIKRVYYIYGVKANSIRGGHRHKKTIQALMCVKGKCEAYVNNGTNKQTFLLDRPEKCLILHPNDWHTLCNFSDDAIVLVLASELYNPEDYISDEYRD